MLALVHGRELLVAERAVQELPALQICRHPSFEGRHGPLDGRHDATHPFGHRDRFQVAAAASALMANLWAQQYGHIRSGGALAPQVFKPSPSHMGWLSEECGLKHAQVVWEWLAHAHCGHRGAARRRRVAQHPERCHHGLEWLGGRDLHGKPKGRERSRARYRRGLEQHIELRGGVRLRLGATEQQPLLVQPAVVRGERAHHLLHAARRSARHRAVDPNGAASAATGANGIGEAVIARAGGGCGRVESRRSSCERIGRPPRTLPVKQSTGG